jgi:hypothetical protein
MSKAGKASWQRPQTHDFVGGLGPGVEIAGCYIFFI